MASFIIRANIAQRKSGVQKQPLFFVGSSSDHLPRRQIRIENAVESLLFHRRIAQVSRPRWRRPLLSGRINVILTYGYVSPKHAQDPAIRNDVTAELKKLRKLCRRPFFGIGSAGKTRTHPPLVRAGVQRVPKKRLTLPSAHHIQADGRDED